MELPLVAVAVKIHIKLSDKDKLGWFKSSENTTNLVQ